MDRNRLMPRAGPFRLNPQDSRHPGGLGSLLEPEFIRRFRRLPQMGKKRPAGICVHLRITPRGSVIAGYPRMGIRSPMGLQMCKLRLWFAREFATTRTERPGPSAPVMGTGSRISGQSKKRRGLTGWESSTMKPQRGKPSLVLRRRSFKGNRPAQSPRGGGAVTCLSWLATSAYQSTTQSPWVSRGWTFLIQRPFVLSCLCDSNQLPCR